MGNIKKDEIFDFHIGEHGNNTMMKVIKYVENMCRYCIVVFYFRDISVSTSNYLTLV
jgi:hypothetical protein